MINNNDSEQRHGNHPHDIFSNPEMLVAKFDAPDRDKWQKPDEVIESLKLPDDAVVVEIGASTGYFVVRLAPYLKNGKIIGFEPSPKMATYLQNRATELGLTNIDARTTKADGSIELEEKADLIFSVDVYHHLTDRIAYFSNIAQHLKSDGMVVVIDRTEEKVEGQPMGHRVPKGQIIEEMKEAGFALVNEYDFLLPIQYYLSFKRTS
ncbi:MAG: class I SAM-dependent methyltransferase [Candidatus Pacebacteria bacterium]|nr:class I SAM-dependent methyltransferase [Candidatus Paceibacterota bacterium]MBP9842648.1 class I SAM-dependent methyltransferase [Candidatus Paceibacterota bacterium]